MVELLKQHFKHQTIFRYTHFFGNLVCRYSFLLFETCLQTNGDDGASVFPVSGRHRAQCAVQSSGALSGRQESG